MTGSTLCSFEFLPSPHDIPPEVSLSVEAPGDMTGVYDYQQRLFIFYFPSIQESCHWTGLTFMFSLYLRASLSYRFSGEDVLPSNSQDWTTEVFSVPYSSVVGFDHKLLPLHLLGAISPPRIANIFRAAHPQSSQACFQLSI